MLIRKPCNEWGRNEDKVEGEYGIDYCTMGAVILSAFLRRELSSPGFVTQLHMAHRSELGRSPS